MKRKPKKRRDYRAPRVTSDVLYERYGLACGKGNRAIPQCRLRGFKS